MRLCSLVLTASLLASGCATRMQTEYESEPLRFYKITIEVGGEKKYEKHIWKDSSGKIVKEKQVMPPAYQPKKEEKTTPKYEKNQKQRNLNRYKSVVV